MRGSFNSTFGASNTFCPKFVGSDRHELYVGRTPLPYPIHLENIRKKKPPGNEIIIFTIVLFSMDLKSKERIHSGDHLSILVEQNQLTKSPIVKFTSKNHR